MSKNDQNNIDKFFEDHNKSLPFNNESNDSLRKRSENILNNTNKKKERNHNQDKEPGVHKLSKFLKVAASAAAILIITLTVFLLNTEDNSRQTKLASVKTIKIIPESRGLADDPYTNNIDAMKKNSIMDAVGKILKKNNYDYKIEGNSFKAKHFDINIDFNKNTITLLIDKNTEQSDKNDLIDIINVIEIEIQEIMF